VRIGLSAEHGESCHPALEVARQHVSVDELISSERTRKPLKISIKHENVQTEFQQRCCTWWSPNVQRKTTPIEVRCRRPSNSTIAYHGRCACSRILPLPSWLNDGGERPLQLHGPYRKEHFALGGQDGTKESTRFERGVAQLCINLLLYTYQKVSGWAR
jgi:hypothetical protein